MAIYIVDHELTYDTHNTYDVVFFGDSVRTTVTHDPAVASQWISDVLSINRHNLLVGLDVEWRPPFGSAATLQLCVGRRCLIYQLIHCPYVPSNFTAFLANPNYTFVGVEIKRDLEKLENDHTFGYNTNAVDLRDVAAEKYGRADLRRAGLKTLAAEVLGKDMEKAKEVTLSNWACRFLSRDQVKYACVDAFVCYEIGRILNASSSKSASFLLEGANMGKASGGGGNSSSSGAEMGIKDEDDTGAYQVKYDRRVDAFDCSEIGRILKNPSSSASASGLIKSPSMGMASGRGGNSSSSKEQMKEAKDKDEGVTAAAVAVGAAAVGVAALAAWGISKWLGGSSDSDSDSDSEPKTSNQKEKMMKAPGRGYYMPRKDFEGNPSDYFRNLRGKK